MGMGRVRGAMMQDRRGCRDASATDLGRDSASEGAHRSGGAGAV